MLTTVTVLVPEAALADEPLPLVRAPATGARPAISFAVSLELKFRLANEADLADLLLQAGVDSDDIASTVRLAAGHAGDRTGCFVKMSVSKAPHESAFRLQRVIMTTATSQTVLERRGSELTIAATGPRKLSSIV